MKNAAKNALKNSIAIGMILLLSIMIGCSTGSKVKNETVSLDDLTYETHRGKIQSLGHVALDTPATHLLRLETGEILYIYSKTFDLNDVDYKATTVEVSGFVIHNEEEDVDTMRIEELFTATTQEEQQKFEETNAHKTATHVNPALGFKIDYSTDWNVTENKGEVTFLAPNNETTQNESEKIQISTLANSQNLNVEQWFLAYGTSDASISYSKSAIGTAQLPAIKIIQDGKTIFYIEGKGTIFVLTHTPSTSEQNGIYSKVLSEMLYSFALNSTS